MGIERDDSGDFVLDPAGLASRFGLSDSDFRRNLQQGFLTSLIEQGEGNDAGTWRLTLRFGNRIWQAVIDTEGEIRGEKMSFSRGTTKRR